MNEVKITFGFTEILLICATIVYLSNTNIKFSFILFATSFVCALFKYSVNESYRADNNRLIRYLSDRIEKNGEDE